MRNRVQIRFNAWVCHSIFRISCQNYQRN